MRKVQDRPEVTVVVPGASAGPHPPPEPDDRHRSPYRLPLALLVVAAVLAAGALVDAGRDSRAAAAQERKLARVVDLQGTGRYARSVREEFDARQQLGRATYAFGVRNDGPREVVVDAAAFGDLALREPVRIAAGTEERLDLVQEVECTARPPRGAGSGPVGLTVRTADGTRHPLELASQSETQDLAGSTARACGYLGVAAAVLVRYGTGRTVGSGWAVDVSAFNGGRQPVQLRELRVGAGLSGRLVEEGTAEVVPLPLALEPRGRSGVPSLRAVTLVLEVADCARLDRAAPGSSGQGAPDAVATTAVGADGTSARSVRQLPEPEALARWLDARCPTD